MQPRLKSPTSPVVNWSILGQLMVQSPAAVVVVNGPPFRGPLITCRPHSLHWPRSLPTAFVGCPAAVVGYAVVVLAERITRQKRHRSTTAEPDALSPGGTNVLS